MQRSNGSSNRKSKPAIVPPVRQYYPLELHGKTYQLCYDFLAIAEAERAAGLDTLFDDFLDCFGPDPDNQGSVKVLKFPSGLSFAALFWAALTPAQPEMTLQDAASLIRPGDDRARIMAALLRAWAMSNADPIDPAGESATPGAGAAAAPERR